MAGNRRMTTLGYSGRVESASFIVEFYEHASPRDHTHWLDLLKNGGALIEQRSERIYRIVCSDSSERQVRSIMILMRARAMQTLCRISEATNN